MTSTARAILWSAAVMISWLMRAPRSGPAMSVPTGWPAATRAMLSGPFRSNTMIGRSFSMHSDTAAPSSTLSWSRSRSAYSSRS